MAARRDRVPFKMHVDVVPMGEGLRDRAVRRLVGSRSRRASHRRRRRPSRTYRAGDCARGRSLPFREPSFGEQREIQSGRTAAHANDAHRKAADRRDFTSRCSAKQRFPEWEVSVLERNRPLEHAHLPFRKPLFGEQREVKSRRSAAFLCASFASAANRPGFFRAARQTTFGMGGERARAESPARYVRWGVVFSDATLSAAGRRADAQRPSVASEATPHPNVSSGRFRSSTLHLQFRKPLFGEQREVKSRRSAADANDAHRKAADRRDFTSRCSPTTSSMGGERARAGDSARARSTSHSGNRCLASSAK